MEDVLKRLLRAEQQAEARVEAASLEREATIQAALDAARALEADFERASEARRVPFMQVAEEGAKRRIADFEQTSEAHHRKLRDLAARHESSAAEAALALLLGEAC
jgi:vacuolar-type H+-ATPase subunit H